MPCEVSSTAWQIDSGESDTWRWGGGSSTEETRKDGCQMRRKKDGRVKFFSGVEKKGIKVEERKAISEIRWVWMSGDIRASRTTTLISLPEQPSHFCAD